MRKTNDAGVNLIKSHERCKLTAYFDGVPNDRYPHGTPTIGWGHTHDVTSADVENGRKITQHQADVILSLDLEDAEHEVERLGVALTDNQFAALVSLVFNAGPSPLHMTLGAKLKAGDMHGAADEFPKWNHSGGKVVAELTKRRAEERALFLKA
jgi:lysozyme